MNLNEALATLETAFPDSYIVLDASVRSFGPGFEEAKRRREPDGFVVSVITYGKPVVRIEGPNLTSLVSAAMARTSAPESASDATECIAPSAHPMAGRPVPASVQAQRDTALDAAATDLAQAIRESDHPREVSGVDMFLSRLHPNLPRVAADAPTDLDLYDNREAGERAQP